MKPTIPTTKEKQAAAFDALKGQFGYTNKMQSPRLLKTVLSAGTGSLKDKKKNDIVIDRLTKISGQKPAARGAKKSIASFKTRIGDLIGFQVTLRGSRMFGFLDKFLNVALPRTKDFRGISPKSVDEMGNVTLGIREHTIFPETSDEDLKDVFGLAITVVSTAENKDEARAFFKHIGFPFRTDAAQAKNEAESAPKKKIEKKEKKEKPEKV